MQSQKKDIDDNSKNSAEKRQIKTKPIQDHPKEASKLKDLDSKKKLFLKHFSQGHDRSLLQKSGQIYGSMLFASVVISLLFSNDGKAPWLELITLPNDWTSFWSYVALTVGIILCCQEICHQMIPGFRKYREAVSKMLGPVKFSTILILSVLSVMAEEILFRGTLQPMIGVFLTSTVFMMLHLTPHTVANGIFLLAFGESLLYGMICFASENIYASLCAHFAVTFTNLMKQYFFTKQQKKLLRSTVQKTKSDSNSLS